MGAQCAARLVRRLVTGAAPRLPRRRARGTLQLRGNRRFKSIAPPRTPLKPLLGPPRPPGPPTNLTNLQKPKIRAKKPVEAEEDGPEREPDHQQAARGGGEGLQLQVGRNIPGFALRSYKIVRKWKWTIRYDEWTNGLDSGL